MCDTDEDDDLSSSREKKIERQKKDGIYCWQVSTGVYVSRSSPSSSSSNKCQYYFAFDQIQIISSNKKTIRLNSN
ncbi:unnamed protein product [Adineta ricciae]|uniref:Uncharacterized protein n=1 Tax=Adineta ricciae TaxID=249248 RepID=A0A814F1K5_ADIRI|nr:unnamed protein product [Adineta ricciae]